MQLSIGLNEKNKKGLTGEDKSLFLSDKNRLKKPITKENEKILKVLKWKKIYLN